MNDYLNGRPTTWILPQENNGGVPVNIQDQTTQPVDTLFAQEVTNFTLASDTVASGVVVIQYTFDASPAHGIVAGNEILLIDVVGNRSFFAVVKLVVVNTITVDRPIDHIFPSATSLGRIVTTEMAVVGSLAAPSIFSIRSGSVATDITRTLITMLDSSAMDDGKFGGIGALANGLVFRVVNSFQKTIFCFKSNQDIKQFCYDLNYSDAAPAGQFGLAARLSFAGPAKHGVAIRIHDDDVLQWVVQDDLTDLDSLKISAEGHLVTD